MLLFVTISKLAFFYRLDRGTLQMNMNSMVKELSEYRNFTALRTTIFTLNNTFNLFFPLDRVLGPYFG